MTERRSTAVPTIPIIDVPDDELAAVIGRAGLSFTVPEARKVADLLGRDPTVVEGNIFNTMWSEHCSYKSSRAVLGEHLPTKGDDVVLGPGEDAGVVRLGVVDGESYCIVVAHESHNHPSQVVPNEGAATGIGGIVRDVYCMGADVIGVMDPLRFGDPVGEHAERTREIIHGVVEGIWQYGNALGVPNLGGDVYFDPCFDDNCLVNVVALGLVREDRVIRSRIPNEARGRDYDVILVGKPTDPSGFGGATFASRILDEEKAFDDKYAVQVPDPFLKRMLAVATQEVLQFARDRGVPIGFKDLGAGGIACATSELGAAAGLGVSLNLSGVHVAEQGMLPEVIACSETQERYSFVVPREISEEVCAIFNERFELPEICHGSRAVVIGKVIDEPRFVLTHEGRVVCDASTEQITTGIAYDRPARKRDRAMRPVRLPAEVDLGDALLAVLGSPNVASREHVFRHYDSEVKGSTVVRPGEADAGVLAPIPGSPLGVAVSCDGIPRYGAVDAYEAGARAVAEAVRNVAAVGAVPIALTDCLNFGDPEVPEVFHDFVEAVRGVGDAARGIGLKDAAGAIPIVSGNVSFYNQSSTGSAIHPSPIVCCVGRLDDVSKHVTQGVKEVGNALYLVGVRGVALGGSAFLEALPELDVGGNSPGGTRGASGPDGSAVIGAFSSTDFDAERRMYAAVTDLISEGLVSAAHDISDGGLIVAASEMMLTRAEGACLGITIDGQALKPTPGDWDEVAALFNEAGGYVLEIAPDDEARAVEILTGRGVWFAGIGSTTSDDALSVRNVRGGVTTITGSAMREAWLHGARDAMTGRTGEEDR